MSKALSNPGGIILAPSTKWDPSNSPWGKSELDN